MWIKYFISFAALFASGCAVSPPAPLSASHPAQLRAASAPLTQPQILNTYRPAVETRTEPEKSTFKDAAGASKEPSAPSMDHSGHGAAKPRVTAPAADDHSAMGHGEMKAKRTDTPAKPKASTQPAPKDASHGHH